MSITVPTADDFTAALTRIAALEAAVFPPVVAPEPPVTPPVDDPPVVTIPPSDPPPAPITDPHAVFQKWADSPYCLRADSLREGTDYAALSHPKTNAPDWDYSGPYDAARAIHNPTCNAQLQLLLPPEKRVDSGTYTVVVPVFIPSEWADEPAEFVDTDGKTRPTTIVSKFLQLAIPSGRYVEKRMQRAKNGITGGVKVYQEGTPFEVLGPDAGVGRKLYNLGSGVGSDCAGPMVGPFEFYFDRWTYVVEHIVCRATQTVGATGGVIDYDHYSLWTVDSPRGTVVKSYDRLPVLHKGSWSGVWIQDSGTHRAPDAPEKHRYWRKVLQLKDAPIDQVLADLAGVK